MPDEKVSRMLELVKSNYGFFDGLKHKRFSSMLIAAIVNYGFGFLSLEAADKAAGAYNDLQSAASMLWAGVGFALIGTLAVVAYIVSQGISDVRELEIVSKQP